MAQPTYTAIRQALANYLGTAISGLRAGINPDKVNLPAAIVLPVAGGTFVTYSKTFDGQADYHVRVIVAVAAGDSLSGEGQLDPYISTTGAQSIWAAVQANPTLSGVVEYAAVIEATGYGIMNLGGVDCLTAHFIVEIGV